MDSVTIREKVKAIEGKRAFLVQLREKPDLGTLKLDIIQALEELDELLEEYALTFPDKNL